MAKKTKKAASKNAADAKKQNATAAEESGEEDEEEAAPTLKVDRAKAKEMLLNLGLKSSAKGDDAKVLGALNKLDDSDETADPGKHKKLFAKVIGANQNGIEIELTGDDDAPAEKAAKSNGKEKSNGKAAKPAKKGGKPKGEGPGRGPGVIGKIADILKAASKKNPVTKEDITKQLAKAFPQRSAESMAKTVNVQVPGRIAKEKGLNVRKEGKAYYVAKS